ncbi:unnamed protein product, partial [marine sediment metagenome]
PRCVSTVDSGNFAASLVAVKEGCLEIAEESIFRAARWDGLVDMLGLLDADLERLENRERRENLGRALHEMEAHCLEARGESGRWLTTLRDLMEGEGQSFERQLAEALEEAEGHIELFVLRDVRIWLDRVHHQIREMDREIDRYAPWLRLWPTAPESVAALARELEEILPLSMRLSESSDRIEKARIRLASGDVDGEAAEWCDALLAALDEGERGHESLRRELVGRAEEAEENALGMDFEWLYDRQLRLFYIGYNLSADQMDSHHYDLLASEARIASFIAIAQGDVPLEHWFHLGRSITDVAGRTCLVSWAGSMFEYLMPSLLFRSEPGTLLSQSESAAIDAQKRFGAEQKVPWGVSESGF